MANLDDLPIQPLSQYSREEGIEFILAMRQRRSYVQVKPTRTKSGPKLPTQSAIDKLSDQQLTDLYYKLMAKTQKEMF